MPTDRPNLLILLCDQLAYDYVGAYGSSVARTPNFDRLAVEGVRLTRAYVPIPICAPSRASLFTGLYAHQHQVMMNGAAVSWPLPRSGALVNRPILPESVPSLGQAFKAAGYRMGYTGPWHLGNDETPQHGWDDYWRTYRYWKTGRDDYLQYLAERGLEETFHREHDDYGFTGSEATGLVPSGRSEIPVEHARTPWAVSNAIKFLENRDDRPWAFCVSIKDPHAPVIMPGDFADLISPDDVELPGSIADDQSDMPHALVRGRVARLVRRMDEAGWRRFMAHYHGLVAHVDTEIGRLLNYLDAHDLADNTVVVLLSDHGEMMGAHRLVAKGPSMYEESVGVPFIVRWPGRLPAGRTSDALFCTVDFVATMAGLCGVDAEHGVGLDFGEVLGGGSMRPRDAVFSEFYTETTVRTDEMTFAKTVITDRWKLNLYLYDRSQMFDLESDPDEMTNLIDSPDHADTRRQLTERIRGWVTETKDPLLPVVEATIARITA